ncbi:unnamed protein product [Closterium sp. NIES-54]
MSHTPKGVQTGKSKGHADYMPVAGLGGLLGAICWVKAAGVVEAAGMVEEVGVELARVEAVALPHMVVEALGVDSSCRASRTTPPLSNFLKGQTCGKPHTEYRCFSRLEDAWVDEYGDELPAPNWLKLQGMGVDVYALDFVQTNKAIYAMYVTELSDEGACYSCVPGDAGVVAIALGASESAAALGASSSTVTGASESAPSESTASAESLHTFTLDSGASRCFFRDYTTLTPLSAPVPVSLADPSGGPVVARASTVLPSCGDLSVAASSRVSASGQLATSCLCRVLSHQTLLWHHCLGHPSLPCLRSMHSHLLVSGLPRSLPSLPRSPAPPCLPCIEGRQRAAPHSSEFPLTTAPLQTLHMDVRSVSPQQNGIAEHRFGLIMEVARTSMIHTVAPHFLWPFVVRYAAHQLNLWPRVWGMLSLVRDAKASKLSSRTLLPVFLGFPTDAPPRQFYHPRSRRVFSSHDVTFDESDCFYRLHPHASNPVPLAPLVLGPAPSSVSQVDPPPLVEPLEISSDSSGPAEGGDPAADDTAATHRSPRLNTPPGFPPRPSSPPPQPAAVDSGAETAGAEPVGAETEGEGSGGAALGGVATGGAGSGGAGSGGAATGGADFGGAASPSGGGAVGDPAGGPGAGLPPQPDLLETLSPQAIRAWIVQRGSSGGGGYCPAGAGAAIPGGTRGAAGAGGAGATSPGGTGDAAGAGGTGAANVGGAAGAGGPGAASLVGARGAGAASAGRARVASAGGGGGTGGAGGAAGPGGTGAASAGGVAGSGGARAATAGGARAAGAGGTTGIGGAGPVGALRHLLGLPLAPTEFPVADTTPLLLFPQLLPHSPLPALAPYTTATESLTERREPKTHASTSERREPEKREYVPARVRRPRAPVVPSTHDMKLRPSSVPQRVVLPSPPASSLSDVADPPSDLPRASSPKVTHLLATVVTGPTFSSLAASALFTELVDFAAAHHLDYLAGLVSDPDPTYPPSVGGEAALGCDVLEDRQEELECLATTLSHLATMPLALEGDPDALYIPTPRSYKKAISGEHSSRWQTAMDAEMAFWKSTGNYIDEVPRPGANIVTHMWIFRVKRPPCSPRAFKARY